MRGITVDLEEMKKPQFIMRVCQNRVIDILRKIEAEQRGGSRDKSKEEFMHLDEVPEEVLSVLMNEGEVLEEFHNMLASSGAEDFGVTEFEWLLFVAYYVQGYTQAEILETYSLDMTQPNLSYHLRRVGNNLLPKVRERLLDMLYS